VARGRAPHEAGSGFRQQAAAVSGGIAESRSFAGHSRQVDFRRLDQQLAELFSPSLNRHKNSPVAGAGRNQATG